jgi:hypothetical protein
MGQKNMVMSPAALGTKNDQFTQKTGQSVASQELAVAIDVFFFKFVQWDFG